jgi:GNAT superfamily N-acetyltransferase
VIFIRGAVGGDIDTCDRIARQYPDELSFVSKVKMRDGVDRREMFVACVDNVVVGFVLWHRCRDGWSTIYDLAVNRDHRGLGIGRALLYTVPCPIRLKCTATNPANKFYQDAGMMLVGTEPSKRTMLNMYHLPILSILVAGGNKRFPDIARESGMAYGTRHDYTPHAWPFMMDFNWSKPYDWHNYLVLIEQYRPIFALVPDYEEHISKEQMLDRVADLRSCGVRRVGVCIKKRGGIDDIPCDCVVCISVPAPKYAGWLPPVEDRPMLAGRWLHLLGGTPRQWFGSKRKWPGDEGLPQVGLVAKLSGYGGQVISIDGSSHESASKRGSQWLNGHWHRPAKGWEIDGEGKNYKMMAVSGRNIVTQMATQTVAQPPLWNEVG